MNTAVWITGSLLALVAIQPARSETQRANQNMQGEMTTQQQPLRRAVSEEAQLRREPGPMQKVGKLSPEERQKLRKDVDDANRDIYRRPLPARY